MYVTAMDLWYTDRRRNKSDGNIMIVFKILFSNARFFDVSSCCINLKKKLDMQSAFILNGLQSRSNTNRFKFENYGNRFFLQIHKSDRISVYSASCRTVESKNYIKEQMCPFSVC